MNAATAQPLEHEGCCQLQTPFANRSASDVWTQHAGSTQKLGTLNARRCRGGKPCVKQGPKKKKKKPPQSRQGQTLNREPSTMARLRSDSWTTHMKCQLMRARMELGGLGCEVFYSAARHRPGARYPEAEPPVCLTR